jgi:hypothetical protein
MIFAYGTLLRPHKLQSYDSAQTICTGCNVRTAHAAPSAFATATNLLYTPKR